jgi:hypothetical protein
VDRHITARVCGLGLGLCLTMAIHSDHATNMLISSQHVSIVESRPPQPYLREVSGWLSPEDRGDPATVRPRRLEVPYADGRNSAS